MHCCPPQEKGAPRERGAPLTGGGSGRSLSHREEVTLADGLRQIVRDHVEGVIRTGHVRMGVPTRLPAQWRYLTTFAWQWLEETAKWLIGHRRDLRRERMMAYGQILRGL